MDKYGHIYREIEENIPEEDKARLDGYLKAKAEDGELARAKQKFEDAMRAFQESQDK